MTKLDLKIPKFLTEKKGIWLFLFATIIFASMVVVIYKPIGYMNTSEVVIKWNRHLYIAIQYVAGFTLLAISRFLFRYVNKKRPLIFRDMIIWVACELVLISFTITCVASFFNAEKELDFIELLERVSVNILSILLIPYIVTILILMLRERRHQIESLNNIIDKQQEKRIENNENLNFYDQGGKLAFSTKKSNVLFIEAADNYSNIHYMNEGKEDTFILHNSLKKLEDKEKYECLLRCHRGYTVNIENIKLIRKDKEGLVIELSQINRSIPVSRTYNEKVVRFFAGTESSEE